MALVHYQTEGVSQANTIRHNKKVKGSTCVKNCVSIGDSSQGTLKVTLDFFTIDLTQNSLFMKLNKSVEQIYASHNNMLKCMVTNKLALRRT